MFKKIQFIFVLIILLTICTTIVSAADNNISDNNENENSIVESNSQQIVVNNNINEESDNVNTEKIIKKNTTTTKEVGNTNSYNITLKVTVKNTSIKLVSDSGSEVAISRNITPVNNKPDATKLGADYAYADENGVYTILGSEIRRVMLLDSYCQQIYGYVPKYTFFRKEGSNVKYIISREKWNVIARSLNGYHVNKGYNAVNTPYSITVNLKNKSRYYNVYYDAQEWINGHQYTCGPTAMSMISQALNTYASEKRLAGLYSTTASEGTSESSIIKNSPASHMKLKNIANTKSSVKTALQSGKMVFWHIKGHYMCVISYNKKSDKFLCLNPSGPSHNINAVQWATWTQMMNTDRPLKNNGFMSVTPYRNLSTINKTHAKYYYYNMGGKYTVPANNEYCNGSYDNKISVIADTPKTTPKTTNQTTLLINSTTKSSINENITIYVDNRKIASTAFKNGKNTINYTLPAYISDNLTIMAKYNHPLNNRPVCLSLSFNRFTSGKTYTNYTDVNLTESIWVEDVVAKKGDNITFTAHVVDVTGNPVNNGKVVFKLNGNTLKRNLKPIKINVKEGIAKLIFTIPSFSAKNYKLTAVYGNDTLRMEDSAVLCIEKLESKITNVKIIQNDTQHILTAKVVDIYGSRVERDPKITVKINSKTVVNKVKFEDGIINITLNTSNYKSGTHNISIFSGENGVYKVSSFNTSFKKNTTDTLIKTRISELKTVIDDNNLNIVGQIVDNGGKLVQGNVKFSIKIDSRTIVNKAVSTDALINQTINISDYSKGIHTLTIVTGSNTMYDSTLFNTTILIS